MSLLTAARRVARLLAQTNHKIVFAESCTAGLVAASLSRIPGISAWHCGGMVTYRNETKAAWLGIDPKLLKRPGPVSEVVAQQMAEGVLIRTPEATIAASVTGHLGPHAPKQLDGMVYIVVSSYDDVRRASPDQTTSTMQLALPKDQGRAARQRLAAEAVLLLVAKHLE